MSELKKYEYTARGGESYIKNTDFYGREIISVKRDGIALAKRSVLLGITDKEYAWTGIGLPVIWFAATFPTASGDKLRPGDIIQVLYK